jgi:transposase
MSVFPTAGHLASWAGRCTGNHQPAGKRKSGKIPEGIEVARRGAQERRDGRNRTNDSYLPAQYRRLKPRIGHGRALGGVKGSILCAIWHLLKNGELYRDLGGDYFRQRDPERQTKQLLAQLDRLGHKVTLEALPRAG